MDSIIQSSIEALRSPKATTRAEAAIRLGNRRHPEAIQPLIECLGDTADEVLLAVMDSLPRYGEAAIAPLMAALQSPDAAVRFAVVHVLAKIQSVEAETALIDALHDPNQDVAEVAADGLRVLNTPNARRALNTQAD